MILSAGVRRTYSLRRASSCCSLTTEIGEPVAARASPTTNTIARHTATIAIAGPTSTGERPAPRRSWCGAVHGTTTREALFAGPDRLAPVAKHVACGVIGPNRTDGRADQDALQAWPVTPDEPRGYLKTVCLGAHLERLAADERERLRDAVMVRLGERPLLDYLRLNIVARRRQPISTEARRRRAIASDGRAIRTPCSAAAPNARPTSKNAPPTAIPNSEICSAM